MESSHTTPKTLAGIEFDLLECDPDANSTLNEATRAPSMVAVNRATGDVEEVSVWELEDGSRLLKLNGMMGISVAHLEITGEFTIYPDGQAAAEKSRLLQGMGGTRATIADRLDRNMSSFRASLHGEYDWPSWEGEGDLTAKEALPAALNLVGIDHIASGTRIHFSDGSSLAWREDEWAAGCPGWAPSDGRCNEESIAWMIAYRYSQHHGAEDTAVSHKDAVLWALNVAGVQYWGREVYLHEHDASYDSDMAEYLSLVALDGLHFHDKSHLCYDDYHDHHEVVEGWGAGMEGYASYSREGDAWEALLTCPDMWNDMVSRDMDCGDVSYLVEHARGHGPERWPSETLKAMLGSLDSKIYEPNPEVSDFALECMGLDDVDNLAAAEVPEDLIPLLLTHERPEVRDRGVDYVMAARRAIDKEVAVLLLTHERSEVREFGLRYVSEIKQEDAPSPAGEDKEKRGQRRDHRDIPCPLKLSIPQDAHESAPMDLSWLQEPLRKEEGRGQVPWTPQGRRSYTVVGILDMVRDPEDFVRRLVARSRADCTIPGVYVERGQVWRKEPEQDDQALGTVESYVRGLEDYGRYRLRRIHRIARLIGSLPHGTRVSRAVGMEHRWKRGQAEWEDRDAAEDLYDLWHILPLAEHKHYPVIEHPDSARIALEALRPIIHAGDLREMAESPNEAIRSASAGISPGLVLPDDPCLTWLGSGVLLPYGINEREWAREGTGVSGLSPDEQDEVKRWTAALLGRRLSDFGHEISDKDARLISGSMFVDSDPLFSDSPRAREHEKDPDRALPFVHALQDHLSDPGLRVLVLSLCLNFGEHIDYWNLVNLAPLLMALVSSDTSGREIAARLCSDLDSPDLLDKGIERLHRRGGEFSFCAEAARRARQIRWAENWEAALAVVSDAQHEVGSIGV